jgi:ABC-2 type transport system permease protein
MTRVSIEMRSIGTATGTVSPRVPEVSRGPGQWLGGYRRMLIWNLLDLRLQLPTIGAVLILQGVGFVLGIGLFFRHIPEAAAVYLATGVPVVNLLTAGLIFEPQVVARQRETGSYEYLQSMPVPRSMTALAWYTVTLMISLPAAAMSLLTAEIRYDLSLRITPGIVPGVFVTSITGVLLGYAIAHAVSAPMVARLVSVSLIFVVFGFSPVTFPARQLPVWLADVNQWLPFGLMTTIMRSSLVKGPVSGLAHAYAVVLAWAVASALVAAWAVSHRR